MENVLFILFLAVMISLLFQWAFRNLPNEQWQILAAVPVSRMGPERWKSINLTYYGVFSANATVAATALFFFLCGAAKVPFAGSAGVAAILLLFCMPASRFIARLVEGRPYTFTAGGSFFVGTLLSPWVTALVNRVGESLGSASIPAEPCLAALAIACSMGEGLGRLACISFGCCYGKPLSQVSPRVRRFFESHCFVFVGRTKKIAYESGLEGEKVVPIQAVTAVLLVLTALSSAFLFLRTSYLAAFIVSSVAAQGWRFVSETLRADYRGEGKVSAYQIMGMIGIIYSLAVALWSQDLHGPPASVGDGLKSLWNPALILILFTLWVTVFIYTGRSRVTGSNVVFHVFHARIHAAPTKAPRPFPEHHRQKEAVSVESGKEAPRCMN
jgi:hypothetical protein